MPHLLKTILFLAGMWGGLAAAEQGPVVVELYTSQGCSSCPPADAMLEELAQRPDVIALALHVDYWDYIGWADDLASPAFTARQQGYAHAAGHATVYTPQMVIGGVDHVVGSRPMQVMDGIQAHAAQPDPVTVELTRGGGSVTVRAASNGGPSRTALVQLVRYEPLVRRDIRRGENAGRTIRYANVVTSWQELRRWNTAQPLVMQVSAPGAQPVVVIVQDGASGAILGAAQVR